MSDSPRFVESAGHKARLLEEGAGPVVVVLHGWGGRVESMGPAIACLAQDHRVVALDLPGFGESPLPEGVWATPDYAAFVGDCLTELGVERAHFVGHSFGGKVSLYLAATRPALVDKLVVQAPSGLRTPPSLKARARRLASRGARAAGHLGPPGRALKNAVYERVASSDYREAGPLRPILVKVVNEDLAPLLPRIKASTLIIWGSEDDALPLAHGKRMEELIPDAGLVVFEGAGHFAYLDDRHRFCVVLRHFLTGGTDGGSKP